MPNCFIMPITTPDNFLSSYRGDKDHFKHVLDVLFEPAIAELGYEVRRPSARGSDLIHDQIIKHLEMADLVLCDMSTLNANVFFELGIRTALDKPVSLVRDDATPRIPFDTAVLNYHTYNSALEAWSLREEVSRLAGHLKDSISGSEGRNTMWRRFGLTIHADLPSEQNPQDAKLNLIIEETSALSRTVDTLAGSSRESRMGAFFSDVLERIDPNILRGITLEPLGDYVVTASPGDPRVDAFELHDLREHLAALGQSHGIKVNFAGLRR